MCVKMKFSYFPQKQFLPAFRMISLFRNVCSPGRKILEESHFTTTTCYKSQVTEYIWWLMLLEFSTMTKKNLFGGSNPNPKPEEKVPAAPIPRWFQWFVHVLNLCSQILMAAHLYKEYFGVPTGICSVVIVQLNVITLCGRWRWARVEVRR